MRLDIYKQCDVRNNMTHTSHLLLKFNFACIILGGSFLFSSLIPYNVSVSQFDWLCVCACIRACVYVLELSFTFTSRECINGRLPEIYSGLNNNS